MCVAYFLITRKNGFYFVRRIFYGGVIFGLARAKTSIFLYVLARSNLNFFIFFSLCGLKYDFF